MKLDKYNLHEDFDVLAIWFREDQEMKDGIRGILHYKSQSIILELFDSFSESFDDTFQHLNRIYGFSQDGKLLALEGCYRVKGTDSIPGFSIDSYSVNEFYILDVNFNKIEGNDVIRTALNKVFGDFKKDPMVESIRFSVNHLHTWIDKTSISTLVFPQENKGAVQFDLGKYGERTFNIHSENLSILEAITLNRNKSNSTYSLEEKSYLKVFENSGEMRNFRSFFQNALYIKKLLEFLNGIPLHFDYLEFLCEKETIPEHAGKFYPLIRGRYFFRQIGERITTASKSALTFHAIEGEFESILNSWYLKKEKLSFILDSYLNDLYLPYYVETQLLNSIRNLEIYYRNFVNDSIEQKKEELREDQQLLTDYVNENVSQPNKEHFIANVNFIGEDSLQKKLSYLFRKLPDKIFESCIKKEGKSPSKSSSSLARSLTQTRNFHTHGYKPELYPDRIQGAQNLFTTNEKLKLFQRYFIYKELGISEDIILKVLIPETYEFQDTFPAE
ncbi:MULTISPECIES: HEPN domain-containing protein [Enterococcus]|uniref:ApeA N-terminal domain 1-containing protein n=1 Tax=Enterococcus TaxID=1350 RepID=UPI00288CE762|nr:MULTISPECIES: HEPN domain-containing protein [Enterococcus]MDT2411870.1 hypothetical protein [Enterococcus avium]MDT2416210.1 hypothetical protein [Enterococcus avium]MDT2424685.1 hypothetical protein [Enterococcus avium]MDT2446632.1 hypothetical protein [Enterococcus avium]MDT2477082.1 hypothetical protein [Enterococcus avium]